ncbi:FAD-dependent oxidoreductase, partial [Candidatus Regiella insecticola]
MNDIQQNYEVIVVGGGMIGAATSLGLAQCGWSVALLEPQSPLPFDRQSAPDLRVSAIG